MGGQFFHAGFISHHASTAPPTARIDSKDCQPVSFFHETHPEALNESALPHAGNPCDSQTNGVARVGEKFINDLLCKGLMGCQSTFDQSDGPGKDPAVLG